MRYDYDSYYFEHMLHMYSGSAKNIFKIRWEFVADIKAQTVLDYGCGCNFLSIFQPHGVDVDSFDIGHIEEGVPYPQTGITRDEYDLVCFFDVIEHVDWENAPDKLMNETIQKATWVVVSVPMKPKEQLLETWKHYKPGEHLTYFTEETLTKFFEDRGFEMVKKGTPECPPRIDVMSFLFTLKDVTVDE